MHDRYSRFVKLIHLIGDFFLLNISFFATYTYTSHLFIIPFSEKYFNLLLLINICWLFTIVFLKIYDIYRVTQIEKIILNLIKAILLHILLISTMIVMFKAHHYSREYLLINYSVFIVLVLFWRILFMRILKIYRKLGFNYRKVVIIGAGPVGSALLNFFNSDQSYGYHFVGFFDDYPEKCMHKEMVLGDVESSKEFVLKNDISEIYFALPDHAGDKVKDLIEFGEENLVRVKIIPDFMRHIPKKVTIDFYGLIPTILIRKEPLESWRNRLLKRAFDVGFSLGVLLFIFPWLVPLITLLVKIESRGAVFYRQNRSGKEYKKFRIWKFRSMNVAHSDEEFAQVTQGDVKVTNIGRLLRRTNLDELPQFINVLLGDMSVVGPRPHPIKLNEQYRNITKKYMIRHLVKPGITGVAQINGFRGETKEPKLMKKRVQHDVWYIENWSFLLDLKLISLTIVKMIKGDKHAF